MENMENENKPVIVLAGLTVKDAAAFIKIAREVVDKTRKEEGCLRYDLLQDVYNPNAFHFIEEYRDSAAFAAHRAMPYMDAFRAERAKLVDEYLGVSELERTNER